MVRNYLVIQQLRQQIEYEIRVPDELLDLPLPRLALQPLVENAIIHGLELLEDTTGRILISGFVFREESVHLTVEDNGIGMDETALEELRHKSTESLTEEMGCGVWNVHQRMIYTYGGQSGLIMSRSILGGLKAELVMYKNGGSHV
ncbi:sensor histidine kinase [Paenibacillus daejeonensis]|uniref:sensor histidine kinase n=1 Tax=Paenibacillus daejeonensis TaxID=135193 RepID=UPI00039C7674|nr:ATP-binding protein [Paenibacillus daejeonensis]